MQIKFVDICVGKSEIVKKLASLFFPSSSRARSCLIADERAAEYTRHLWAMLTKEQGKYLL